jgi:hypothetical protein
MSGTGSKSEEKRVRGTVVVGLRDAAAALWGSSGVTQIAGRLPEGTRAATTGHGTSNLEWFPEQYVLDWYQAVWNGPAGGDRKAFFGFLDKMMDLGFGRVRKALLMLAKPALLIDRAEALWRHDHSHGHLQATLLESGARLVLTDHPYVSDPMASMAIAEIYRYGFALCRVKNVTATHRKESADTLLVNVTWTT